MNTYHILVSFFPSSNVPSLLPFPPSVSLPATPCELHCRPVDESFSEKMLDAVLDGTPCFLNSSRSICINGVCKVVWQGMSPLCLLLASSLHLLYASSSGATAPHASPLLLANHLFSCLCTLIFSDFPGRGFWPF